MRTLTSLLAPLALATCTGCGLVQSIYHNALACPRDFLEERREEKRNKAMAEQALAAATCGLPRGAAYSSDFAQGFREGYIDFMTHGGDGEPPPLPPRRYWSVRAQTSRGRDAAQDWFDGFRLGAASARAHGVRTLVTVPTPDAHSIAPTAPPPPTTTLGPPQAPAAPPAPVGPPPRIGMPASAEPTPASPPPATPAPAAPAAPAAPPAGIPAEKSATLMPGDAVRVGVPAALTPYEQLTLPPRFMTPPLPTQPPQPPLQRLGRPSAP